MFKRIVLLLDAGEAGEVATSFTVALARENGAVVHVVHVNEYLLGGRGITTETHLEAAEIVATALRAMHDAGVRATGVTYRTTPFDLPAVMCDVADHVEADLIVVGSRRRRRHALVRRGMRDRIMRRTSLPVLAAPPPLRVRPRELHSLAELDADLSLRH